MKLFMFSYGERESRFGTVVGDYMVDLNLACTSLMDKEGVFRSCEVADALVPSDLVRFLQGGERSWNMLGEVLKMPFALTDKARGKRYVFKLDEVSLANPIQNPEKVICMAHNYHDFVKEVGVPIPPEPRMFSKYNNALCGPNDPIVYPKMTKCLGYEAELAFVIGKTARNVEEKDALSYIAGYTIFNDVSASDLTSMDKQVLRGKTFDTFAPVGPCLVTSDEVGDAGNLDVKLWVNDVLLQNSNTKELVYDIPTLVSFLSRVFSLTPGDIVATGTPGGLAKDRNPTTYMKVGDTCTIKIEKLGILSNRIVEE
jgi:acylpyruvate hydrolase